MAMAPTLSTNCSALYCSVLKFEVDMVLGLGGLKNKLGDERDDELDAISSPDPGAHVQMSVLNSESTYFR